MAEMDVRETAPGEFLWQWSAQNDKRPIGNDLTPHWPEAVRRGPTCFTAAAAGLRGR